MPTHTYTEPQNSGPLPPGEYLMTVVGAVEKQSASGNEMIVLDLDCEAGQVRDYLVFSRKAAWRVNQFLKATKLAPPPDVEIDVTPELVLGASGWVRVRHETDDEGRAWPRVAAWLREPSAKATPQSGPNGNPF